MSWDRPSWQQGLNHSRPCKLSLTLLDSRTATQAQQRHRQLRQHRRKLEAAASRREPPPLNKHSQAWWHEQHLRRLRQPGEMCSRELFSLRLNARQANAWVAVSMGMQVNASNEKAQARHKLVEVVDSSLEVQRATSGHTTPTAPVLRQVTGGPVASCCSCCLPWVIFLAHFSLRHSWCPSDHGHPAVWAVGDFVGRSQSISYRSDALQGLCGQAGQRSNRGCCRQLSLRNTVCILLHGFPLLRNCTATAAVASAPAAPIAATTTLRLTTTTTTTTTLCREMRAAVCDQDVANLGILVLKWCKWCKAIWARLPRLPPPVVQMVQAV